MNPLKQAIKTKLRKQAGLLGAAKHLAMPLAYGSVATLAGTPQGSGASYFGTDMLRNSLEGGIYFNKHVPTPFKLGAMFLNPLGNIKSLNRTDPRAMTPYKTRMPSYERTGIS
jgi:hypothetical protein